MPKGIGDRPQSLTKAFSKPAELKLDKLDITSLNEELGKSRILEAVRLHIERDLDIDAAKIDFSLDFSLDI